MMNIQICFDLDELKEGLILFNGPNMDKNLDDILIRFKMDIGVTLMVGSFQYL